MNNVPERENGRSLADGNSRSNATSGPVNGRTRVPQTGQQTESGSVTHGTLASVPVRKAGSRNGEASPHSLAVRRCRTKGNGNWLPRRKSNAVSETLNGLAFRGTLTSPVLLGHAIARNATGAGRNKVAKEGAKNVTRSVTNTDGVGPRTVPKRETSEKKEANKNSEARCESGTGQGLRPLGTTCEARLGNEGAGAGAPSATSLTLRAGAAKNFTRRPSAEAVRISSPLTVRGSVSTGAAANRAWQRWRSRVTSTSGHVTKNAAVGSGGLSYVRTRLVGAVDRPDRE